MASDEEREELEYLRRWRRTMKMGEHSIETQEAIKWIGNTEEVLQSRDCKEYMKAVIKSRGYTLPELGDLQGVFRPGIVPTFDMNSLIEFSKIAVAEYNERNGTKYKLHKVVRGNTKLMGSIFFFYITFIVKRSREYLELQATVSQNDRDIRVDECLISRF